MIGAEKIQNKILTDAKSQQESIIAEAKEQAEAIIAASEKEAFQKITLMAEKAKEEAILIKQRYQASESMEDRKNTLKVRQECIDEAFDLALGSLSKMQIDKYKTFIAKIIIESARDEKGLIAFNVEDKKRLGEGFVSEINKRLKEKSRSAELELAKDTIECAGGFVLRYGEMEINCTLEVILNMRRPNLESEVAKILFNDE